MRKRLVAAIAALAVVLVAFVAGFHNGAARFALASVLPIFTGYSVHAADVRLQHDHGALVDVHVMRGSEPVLDARRIDVYYRLRDLLPGSRHRFGLTAVTIDNPHITIVHHEDGTYNVSLPAAAQAPAAPAPPNPIPLNMTARIRDASVSLVDQYRYYKGSRLQRIDGINADVSIDTANKTAYLVKGALEDGGPQPFRMAGSIDFRTGFALHHISVRAIPIATIGNYFINSPAAHILTGTVRGFDMQAWSFGEGLHLSGVGKLVDGSMRVANLDAPIGHINGPINVFDSGFAARNMTARVAHIPVAFSGGIFNFSDPQFRLGVNGSGDLRYLHEVAHFADNLPIRGNVQIHALIEGSITQPILVISFDGRRFYYQDVPIDSPHGDVALYNGNLIVLPFHGYYSGIKMHVEGNLQLGKNIRSVLALHAVGSSAKIPYLSGMIAAQPILTEVLINGVDLKVDARGYLVSMENAENANGFYSIDEYGRGSFGPITLRAPNGGTLVAGFGLDRPHGNSAFWASVRNLQIHQPVPVDLPGVSIPELPPMEARVVSANLAGAGSAKNVVIGGTALLSPATISNVPFSRIDASFAGPFAASQISRVRASGPWGSFAGTGTFAPNLIAASGNYRGSFGALHMFLGDFPVRGGIAGNMAIAIVQNKIYVQARNAQLANASMHGIPISSASGTMAYDSGVLRVYSAQARAAGGTVVAAGSFATGPTNEHTRLAIATTALNAGVLHTGFGVPISQGSLRAIGAIVPGPANAPVPNVDAGMVLQNGKAAGYGPFATTAEIAIANGSLRISNALAGIGDTFASVNGTVGGLAASSPSLDVNASVPIGQIAPMAELARLPAYHADGSFEGNVQIGGTAASPSVHGTVAVPVGQINGLGFSDARARIAVSRAGASVQDGYVQVGSTHASLAATIAKDETAFAIKSPAADLSDFNDFFDTGDTLAGKGPVSFTFAHFADLTFTAGNINVRGLRYRSFPIGDTVADWSAVRNIVQGHVLIGGPQGQLNAAGKIGLAPVAEVSQLVAHSSYDINATLSNFNLTTWLPVLGFPQLPITGRIVGAAQVRGNFPHIAVTGNAAIHNGTLGPLTIDEGSVTARSAPGDRINITDLVLGVPGLQATGSGSFGLSKTAPMQLEVHAATNDLPRLVAQISKKHLDVTGKFETTLTLGGTFSAPTFSAGIDAEDVMAYGVSIPSMIGELSLNNNNIVVRNSEFTFAKGTAAIAGSLPLQLQPFAFGPLDAPISMDLSANGVDLSAFAHLLGYGTKLTGTLEGHLGVSGSVRDPRLYGQVSAQDVNYTSELETTPITNTVAVMTFEGTHATLDRLHAQLGNGVLDGSGRLTFGGGLNGGPLGYEIALRSRGAQLSMPQFGEGTFDSSLTLRRDAGELATLSGHVKVTDAVLPFNAFLQFGGTPGAPSAGPPFNLGFDLKIAAGRNVRVRGGGAGIFGLDISGEGLAHLAGTLERPTLDGQFNSTGGTLTYVDRAFRVQRGSVTFDPAAGVIPNIFAVATTHVTNPDPDPVRNPTGSADITVTVTGPVTSPRLSFQSNPSGYTDQQIIALLLPLGGLVGPIQFTDTGVILPATQLSGAPLPGTGGVLPNVLVRRENGTLSVGQEAFNILNAQFATGLLSPVETALGNTLGLSNVNLTLNYTGNVGLNFRRLLSQNFYAIYGTTFGFPVRQTFGFAYQPNSATSVQFAMFFQQGLTPIYATPSVTLSTNARATAGQPIQGNDGFTFLYQRLF